MVLSHLTGSQTAFPELQENVIYLEKYFLRKKLSPSAIVL